MECAGALHRGRGPRLHGVPAPRRRRTPVCAVPNLEHSARDAADSRAHQIIEHLRTEAPQELNASLLATDGQIGAIQILDTAGNVVAASPGTASPVLAAPLPPGETASLGRLAFGQEPDYWVTAHGTLSPTGPVTQ